MFHRTAIMDEKQMVMQIPEDLLPGRIKQLIIPESVSLINPTNPYLTSEVSFIQNV